MITFEGVKMKQKSNGIAESEQMNRTDFGNILFTQIVVEQKKNQKKKDKLSVSRNHTLLCGCRFCLIQLYIMPFLHFKVAISTNQKYKTFVTKALQD